MARGNKKKEMEEALATAGWQLEHYDFAERYFKFEDELPIEEGRHWRLNRGKSHRNAPVEFTDDLPRNLDDEIYVIYEHECLRSPGSSGLIAYEGPLSTFLRDFSKIEKETHEYVRNECARHIDLARMRNPY